MRGEDQCEVCGGWDGVRTSVDGAHVDLRDCIHELIDQRDKATRSRNEVLDRVAGIQLFADNMKKAEEMQRALTEKAAKWALSMHYHTPEKTP